MPYNPSDSINAKLLGRLEEAWQNRNSHSTKNIEPFNRYDTVEKSGMPLVGERLLRQKKAACLIVAGGQGTRLGFNGPKGCVEVAPGVSLFKLFADKIVSASRQHGQNLPVAIMTSPENHAQTLEYFERNNYFGLSPEQLSFFSQSQFPFFDDNGQPSDVWGPSGNGVSLNGLCESGIALTWKNIGVEHVIFVQIDNPLADPFDVALLGYHSEKKSEVTLKAILRDNPLEKVGVIVKEEGKVAVVEYNEIDPEQQAAVDAEGYLLHPCANLSLFAFSMEFIDRLQELKAWDAMPLHVAHKKIPQKENSWGYKFEYFIFDVLPFAEKVKVLVYPREKCFAPIKDRADLDRFRQDLQF